MDKNTGTILANATKCRKLHFTGSRTLNINREVKSSVNPWTNGLMRGE